MSNTYLIGSTFGAANIITTLLILLSLILFIGLFIYLVYRYNGDISVIFTKNYYLGSVVLVSFVIIFSILVLFMITTTFRRYPVYSYDLIIDSGSLNNYVSIAILLSDNFIRLGTVTSFINNFTRYIHVEEYFVLSEYESLVGSSGGAGSNNFSPKIREIVKNVGRRYIISNDVKNLIRQISHMAKYYSKNRKIPEEMYMKIKSKYENYSIIMGILADIYTDENGIRVGLSRIADELDNVSNNFN